MLILTPLSFFIVTAAVKPKQVQQIKDKENVFVNNNSNRAIVAISMIKKPTQPNKPSVLKHVLKKSMSVQAPPPSAVSHLGRQKVLSAAHKHFKSQDNETTEASRTGAIKKVHSVPIGQRQFQYAEEMKKRKEELARKVKEQEEKELKFQFTANPAPKFKKMPVQSRQQSVEETKMVKQSSLPHIPLIKRASKEVLVPSCGDPDRLKYLNEKKQLALAKYNEQPVQFKAKPAMVLKKPPFQPVHHYKVSEPFKPFKLHLTDRLLQRSEFDKKLHETIAIRKMQEDVRQRQRDLADRKLIRQKTEFRANANPFRNYQ